MIRTASDERVTLLSRDAFEKNNVHCPLTACSLLRPIKHEESDFKLGKLVNEVFMEDLSNELKPHFLP